MKHLIIILCKSAPSFCHYSTDANNGEPHLIPIETLRHAILLAMKENASIQFVYPKYELPIDYYRLIASTNHVNIKPFMVSKEDIFNIDIHNYPSHDSLTDANIIIRLALDDLVRDFEYISCALSFVSRINIALVIPKIIDDVFIKDYRSVLDRFVQTLVNEYQKGHYVQFNLITDRAFLSTMNNCNAGIDSLTISPNGDIFICPGFFYDKMGAIGNLTNGYDICNKHLYGISSAPICRICDAFHCKRCIWKNKKSTLEVNTPGHEQCVVTHIERNATAEFVKLLREEGIESKTVNDIQVCEELDPFYKLPRIYLK